MFWVLESNTQMCITLHIIWKFSTCSYSFICCLKTFKASWNLQYNNKILQKKVQNVHSIRGTKRPNVYKYARSVSNGFICPLETYLINLELP